MESARDLLAIPNPVPVQLVSDAHDIFATLQCSRPYQGADESLSSYMECLREDLLTGAVDEFLWVPTTSMLADGGSKVMDDKLAQALLRDGGWWPEEYKLLQRATMDGAELIDRRRRSEEETAREDQFEFGVSLAGDAFSWFYGCSGLLVAGGGCGGTCPWRTESHYDDPERKSFLSFWTGTDDLPEDVLAGPGCSGAGVASSSSSSSSSSSPS